MNGFLKGVMSTLLGWLNPLFSSAWGVFNGQENLLSFIGKNWKGLVLVLCLAGIAVDLAVYLLRWKPWRVWRSFWLRLRDPAPGPETGREESEPEAELESEPESDPLPYPYPEEAAWQPETPAGPEGEAAPQEAVPAPGQPIRRNRRSRRAAPAADTYYDPYYPPQWQEPGTLGTQRRQDP